MDEINIEAKSDRELLIMIIGKMNNWGKLVDEHEKSLKGNGLPGLKAQVWALWGLFGISATIAIYKIWGIKI